MSFRPVKPRAVAASTKFGFDGSTRIHAIEPAAKIVSPSSVQVCLPSIDFNMPKPAFCQLPNPASPVPTEIILGSLGAKAIAPVAKAGWESVLGIHDPPESRLSQIPPEAVPTSQWLEAFGSTDIALIRPAKKS